MIVDREDSRCDSEEICSHCSVIICTDGTFEVHTCPGCGADIYPCNVCEDPIKDCNTACPLNNNVKVIGTFDGGYSRKGVISRRNATCSICKEDKHCIGMDNSEEEYRTGYICFSCIEKEEREFNGEL